MRRLITAESLLLAAIDQVPLSGPPRPAYTYHRVRRGETLSTIARRYNTSVKKINKIDLGKDIRRSLLEVK